MMRTVILRETFLAVAAAIYRTAKIRLGHTLFILFAEKIL
jgi:hypothetical protein